MLGSDDSVLVLMHDIVTYLAYLLTVCILASTFLHAQTSPPDYLLRARLRPNHYSACAERVALGD